MRHETKAKGHWLRKSSLLNLFALFLNGKPFSPFGPPAA
jgi:hypothetical protein